ncbi:MAG TPA: helix-turn-helix domain-containing protein [Nitrososphaeraceae archaeon]
MPRIITLQEKLAVIDEWLSGESRMDIARNHNIGNGTVYYIIQEWSNGIGAQQADRLREIAIKLKQNGLTVSDCAKGLRMLMMLKKYEIKDDEIEERVTYFLKDIYTKCQEVGLTPQKIFDYIGDILKFSSEISISQIPLYIKKKIQEKEDLESAVQQLSKKTKELTDIQEDKRQELTRLSKMEDRMTQTYKIFTSVKFRLEQFGIKMDDMDRFVKSVVGMSRANYDYVQILDKIAEHEKLEKDLDYYKEEIARSKNESAKLNQEIHDKKNDLFYYNIKLDFLHELELRGFGIEELRTLIHMINEIGLEHNIDYDEIRKEFFDDVKNYEEVIGSRNEIERLKKELKILEEQIIKEREKYNAYPKIIESITRLAGAKVSEDDIVKIDKILSMTDYYIHKDKSLYKKTLIDDLQKYGNLKSAIKNLEDMQTDLKSKKMTRDKPLKKESTTVKKIK